MAVDGIGWNQVVANAAAEGDARQVVVDSQADDKVQSRNAKKTYLAQKVFSADNQDRIRYKSTSEANRVTLENLKSALAGKFGDPVAQGVYRSLFDAKVVNYQKRNGTEVQTYRPVSAAEITLADQLASALSQARASAISAATEAGDTAGVTPAHVDAAINELVTGDDALDLVAGNELSTEGLQQFREQLGQKLASIAESRQAFEARFHTALLLLELDNQQGLPDHEGQTARQVAINERTLQLRAAPESRGKGRGVIFPEVKTAHDQPKTVDANQLHGVSEAKIYQRGERSAAAIQHEREVHNRQTLPETLALEHADIAVANAKKELDIIPQLELELDHIRLLAASGLDVIHALEDEITGLEQQLRDLTQVAVGADDKEALTLQLASAKQALDRLRSGVDQIDNLESERQELDGRANDLGRRLLEVESTESDLSTEREQLLQRKTASEQRIAELNKKKDKKLTFLSRTERNELKRLSAELPTITQDAADRDRQLQEHRATKQALFEQKASIDTRRIHLDGVFSELDGQRSKIEDIQSKLDVAQGVVSSADNLRDQISALETEVDEQRVLRGNYRDSYRSKQQEIFTRLDEARRTVDRAISNPTHRAERDAAQAHINVHGLTQGSITPGDLTVKQQEQALSLLRIKIGALNDFLKGGSGAQEAAKGAGASSVEAATQQRVVLATLERQLLTELQATRIDQFFKARENVKVLSAAAREDVSAAEKEHRARAFYEAKDTLVDQRAQFHPVIGQGQITDVLDAKFVKSLSSDALSSALVKAVENRPPGTPISKVIDARSKAWGAEIRQGIIENLRAREDAVSKGLIGAAGFGDLEREILDYLTPSQLQTRLLSTLSHNGNSFHPLFKSYNETKVKVAALEEIIASRDREIQELESDIQANTDRNKRQRALVGIEKLFGTHEGKAVKRFNLAEATAERDRAEEILKGQRKLLREYKPQVAVLAEAASRVPSGLWDEGVEVSEVKAKLDADPYTRAVLSAATATQLADHGRFDAGGVANIKRLLTSVPEDLIIEFTGPKSR